MQKTWAGVLGAILLWWGAAGGLGAQGREGAALLPVSFLGLPQVQANFLLNSLQDRLSREFALVAQTEVEDAYEQALMALPGEQCTEENCVALVQEYLKVDLIFNLQVLQDEASGLAQLTLSLVEGRRKTVRSVQCPKCGLEQLLEALESVTSELLSERGRGRGAAQAEPGIRVEPPEVELREGSAGTEVRVGVRSALRGAVVLRLSSPNPRLRFTPPELKFDQNDWDSLKIVKLSVLDDNRMSGTEGVVATVSVVQASADIPYSFLGDEAFRVTVADDDQAGLLALRSTPGGAQVFVNARPYLDRDGAPVLTPATIELQAGSQQVELRKSGFRSELIRLEVSHTRLGTRTVILRPEGATLQVIVAPENREGVIVINDTTRVSLDGASEKALDAEAGTYRVRLEQGTLRSPEQTVALQGKETRTLRFGRLEAAQPQTGTSQPADAPVTSQTRSELAFGIETLVRQGSGFPADRMRLTMPRVGFGLRRGGFGAEASLASGQGTLEPTQTVLNNQIVTLDRVQVTRLSGRVFRRWGTGFGVELLGGGGLTRLVAQGDQAEVAGTLGGWEYGARVFQHGDSLGWRAAWIQRSTSTVELELTWSF